MAGASIVPGAGRGIFGPMPSNFTAIEIFSPLPNRWVIVPSRSCVAQLIANRPRSGRRRPPHRIAGARGLPPAATRWLVLAIDPSEAIQRLLRREWTPSPLWGCRPGSAPRQFREKPDGPPARACRPQSRLRWREEEAAALARVIPRRRGAAPASQGGGILQGAVAGERDPAPGHRQKHRKLQPLLACRVIRVTPVGLGVLAVRRRWPGRQRPGSPPASPPSFSSCIGWPALTTPAGCAAVLRPHQWPS